MKWYRAFSTCLIVYLRGKVVSLATMILVILNTYWIRWTFYLFAAISHCSLQRILKNLHKMQHLAYLKWLLKFHCFYLTDRTENYPTCWGLAATCHWVLAHFVPMSAFLTDRTESLSNSLQIELRKTILGSVILMEHSVAKVQMTSRFQIHCSE